MDFDQRVDVEQRAQSILAGLDAEQREVALAVGGPVRVLAGAGTGKTRAITHRIAYSVVTGASEAERTLALTFTNRAAGEMRHRLRGLGVAGVQVRTFHAAALRQLRFFWPQLSRTAFPDLMSSKAPIVARALAHCKVDSDTALLRDVSGDLEWCKSNMMDSALIHKAKRDFAIDVGTLAKVMDSYETLKKDRNLLDFDDILMLMSAAIRTRPDIATAVHSAYRWFTVDEFQDVNPLQKSVMDLWVGERDDICVVGDPSQTIYSFTGASSKYLVNFATTYPHATRVELVRCYRCSPEIVAMANAVIHGDARSKPLTLRSQQGSGPPPTISAYADDHDEAENVAAAIKKLISSGTLPADIAILFRINAQSAEFESALSNLDIPLVLRGTERFFERPEVKSALTMLRGDAKNTGLAPTNLAEHVRDVLSSTGWSPQAPRGTGAVREKWESLLALMTMAEEADPSTSLGDFITELDARASVEHAPTADAVTLASIHSAKGLEWPVVFLVGCSEGLLPLSYADSEDGVDEERRLAYVGISRAARILEVSWGRSRAPGGKATRTLSRFFAHLPRDLVSATTDSGLVVAGSLVRGSSRVTHPRKRTGPKPCRVCGKGLVTASERTIGRCQRCPGEPNEIIFDTLRTWRKEKSLKKGVPAYIVFTDATLSAMAELVPGDLDELAAIPGVGPAKLTEFGAELLAIIHLQQ